MFCKCINKYGTALLRRTINNFQWEMFTLLLYYIWWSMAKFLSIFKIFFEGLNTLLRVCLMFVFNNVIYNALLHRWYTTKNNRFLMKLFAVIMPSYLTFAAAKVKIKLLSHFFPNSHGWRWYLQFTCSIWKNFEMKHIPWNDPYWDLLQHIQILKKKILCV